MNRYWLGFASGFVLAWAIVAGLVAYLGKRGI